MVQVGGTADVRLTGAGYNGRVYLMQIYRYCTAVAQFITVQGCTAGTGPGVAQLGMRKK